MGGRTKGFWSDIENVERAWLLTAKQLGRYPTSPEFMRAYGGACGALYRAHNTFYDVFEARMRRRHPVESIMKMSIPPLDDKISDTPRSSEAGGNGEALHAQPVGTETSKKRPPPGFWTEERREIAYLYATKQRGNWAGPDIFMRAFGGACTSVYDNMTFPEFCSGMQEKYRLEDVLKMDIEPPVPPKCEIKPLKRPKQEMESKPFEIVRKDPAKREPILLPDTMDSETTASPAAVVPARREKPHPLGGNNEYHGFWDMENIELAYLHAVQRGGGWANSRDLSSYYGGAYPALATIHGISFPDFRSNMQERYSLEEIKRMDLPSLNSPRPHRRSPMQRKAKDTEKPVEPAGLHHDADANVKPEIVHPALPERHPEKGRRLFWTRERIGQAYLYCIRERRGWMKAGEFERHYPHPYEVLRKVHRIPFRDFVAELVEEGVRVRDLLKTPIEPPRSPSRPVVPLTWMEHMERFMRLYRNGKGKEKDGHPVRRSSRYYAMQDSHYTDEDTPLPDEGQPEPAEENVPIPSGAVKYMLEVPPSSIHGCFVRQHLVETPGGRVLGNLHLKEPDEIVCFEVSGLVLKERAPPEHTVAFYVYRMTHQRRHVSVRGNGGEMHGSA
ncbi:MAG: hypothetical protein HYW25_00375 [Candidatus Aenigmarchaeota archaeon]|nr:hypothetical protein [Candidatus Aenigmarchaeota archaeon]